MIMFGSFSRAFLVGLALPSLIRSLGADIVMESNYAHNRNRVPTVLGRKTRALIRLRSEDQKIIHAVGFHEILRVEQFVSGLGGFANDHVFTHAMISSVAIAINDANLRSWF